MWHAWHKAAGKVMQSIPVIAGNITAEMGPVHQVVQKRDRLTWLLLSV